MKHCRCRVSDWAKLLGALGWTSGDAAGKLGVTKRAINYWKHGPHRCTHGSTERVLRIYLQSPDLQRRLAEAGVSDPWPDDRAK